MDTSPSQPPPQPPQPELPPVPPPEDPAVVGARIKRRLLMGAALAFAMLSIYSGLLGIPWGIQVGMAGMAVFCVIRAFRVPGGTF